MDADQLRKYIVRPALKAIDAWSPAAEGLVMGTAAQESHLKYVRQLGDGPALGLFQMEPATHDDIWNNYLHWRERRADKICQAIQYDNIALISPPSAERMMWDFRYAAIMCRVHYRRVPKPLPDEHDIHGLAAYWKEFYNTPAGAGTADEFVNNYGKWL